MTDQVGRQVSVYIRADDLALWRRVEAYARTHRMPVSGLVMAALESYLAERDPPASRKPKPAG